MDVTRWREDATCDFWGQYCYVRDLDDGRVWSAGRQPIGQSADEYVVELRPNRAAIQRRDGEIETRYEVAVVSDADAEVRRITLTNHGDRPRTLEVTSYAEVALNPRRADQAHPAFAKLFLETEYLSGASALLCRRRPRARDEQAFWALHVLAGPEGGAAIGDVQFETDRARFLGRGRSAANPAALETKAPLSGTYGPVLDPVFSLRRSVRLAPGTSAVLAFNTATPRDREEGLAVLFVTNNPRFAHAVGDRFLLLAGGQVAGRLTREDVDVSDLTRLMAGGEEFAALSTALEGLPPEPGPR